MLKQRIAIANLKIAYLFESVGYENEIVEKIEEIDSRIKSELKVKDFLGFIALNDPYETLMKLLETEYPEIFREVNRFDCRLNELNLLIQDLKQLLYGTQT